MARNEIQNGKINPKRRPKPKCETCGKPHKTEDCSNGANVANDPRPKRHNAAPKNRQNLQHHYTRRGKKLKLPRLRFGDNVDARAYSIEDPPTQYNRDSSQACNGHPTQDWQRRREKAAIKKYNSRHPDQRKYPSWITEAEDKYMTTKRPFPPTPEQDDDHQTKKSKLTPPNTPNTNIQHQFEDPVTSESFAQTTTIEQQH